MRAYMSLRISPFVWQAPALRGELLAWLREYRQGIDEVAFFTAFTHPPRPLAVNQQIAAELREIIPEFAALGLRVGINHLATIGHLDENLDNSLREDWQHLVDISGAVSPSCYCAADPAMQQYISASYTAFAQAGPSFIWVDDDVRMESHPRSINFACFCPRCLADFSAETNHPWTLDELRHAFAAPRETALPLRRQWLAHSRSYITRILQRIRQAVDTVSPAITLGFMTAEINYSGLDYPNWVAALAGNPPREVKLRPGGGFYTDDAPLGLLDKAHGVGRQNARVPPAVREIQYEHENFPYQMLQKSRTIYTAEMAAALATGCTGVALNIMGPPDPIEEYRPRFAAVAALRPFLDEVTETFGRTPNEGVWVAATPDHPAALEPEASWPGPGAWGGDFKQFNEFFQLGIPPAYARSGARAALLSGDGVLEWSRAELETLFAGGVLMDGPALLRLTEMGLGELAGFHVAGTRDVDTIERLSADPLNGHCAGWQRDCRPSFWPHPTYLLHPLEAGARVLAECIDFTPRDLGACAGAYENALGGRVAIFGYYPWSTLQNTAKVTQLRRTVNWLTRGTLPAAVTSYHRLALWARRDAHGHPAFLLLNASLDAAEDAILHLADPAGAYEIIDMHHRRHLLAALPSADGLGADLNLPPMPAWSAVLVRRGG